MENFELINIWKEQNAKIEKSLSINELLLKELINTKARNTLRSLISLKTAGIIAFILYLMLLAYALVYAVSHYSSAWLYFIISVTAIAIINIKGLADYIKHLTWARRIDYNGTIIDIQRQLSRLQLSIISHAKIMCLQFPFLPPFISAIPGFLSMSAPDILFSRYYSPGHSSSLATGCTKTTNPKISANHGSEIS